MPGFALRDRPFSGTPAPTNLLEATRITEHKGVEDDMRYKEFWIALGLGALAGGIAALLYAPQSGAQTRKKLKRSLEDAGDALEDAGDYLKEQAERLGREAQKLVERGSGSWGGAAEAAGDALRGATKATKAASRLI